MNVGFIAPQSIAAVNGGVRTQSLFTAKELQNIGVSVHFISPWDDISSLNLDLIHIFSASIENIGIVQRLKEMEIPMVLSPVLFSNRSASSIRRLLKFEEKISSINAGIRSEFGIKKDVCVSAKVLLPNTVAEAKLIEEAFQIPNSSMTVIPNGVEERFVKANSKLFVDKTGLKDFVLFAGQASAPRKNVLSLLKAFEHIKSKLVIIGDFNDSDYASKCLELVEHNENVHIYPTQKHDSAFLSSAYAACQTFVLPSQFETPGIAAMEAALAGANIVITEFGGTQQYFREFAQYISPHSISSIKNGILKSLNNKKSDSLKNHISTNYLWSKVAEGTLEAYKSVLE